MRTVLVLGKIIDITVQACQHRTRFLSRDWTALPYPMDTEKDDVVVRCVVFNNADQGHLIPA